MSGRLLPGCLLALLLATPPATAQSTDVRAVVDAARPRVEAFFGAPFEEPFDVVVLPDRAAFTDYAKKAWGFPDTQCWMVAAGVARALVVLDPAAWTTDACEHDPADSTEVRQILTHELVHVYHGQRAPDPDFNGMDEVGWFAEGVAVYASGQLETGHRARAKEAVEKGAVPEPLANAWSGPYRYGIAGTMAEYIDRRWGRETLVKLLSVGTQAELLDVLGVTEPAFLAGWEAFVRSE